MGQNWAYFHSTSRGFRDTGQISELPYLGMKLGHWQQIQKLYIYFLSTPGVKIGLSFTLWAAIFEMRADFQNCYIFGHETWSLVKVPELAHIASFLPQGVKIELTFALWTAVSEIWADFQNCHIGAWNLAIGQSSRCCTYTPFLPQGSNLSLFSLYGYRFPRYRPIIKIAMFGYETWQLAKVAEVAYITTFYPWGSKLRLFLLYGQQFLRYGPIIKIAIFEKFQETSFVWIVTGNIQKRFGRKVIKTVGGVAFWNFHSHRVSC